MRECSRLPSLPTSLNGYSVTFCSFEFLGMLLHISQKIKNTSMQKMAKRVNESSTNRTVAKHAATDAKEHAERRDKFLVDCLGSNKFITALLLGLTALLVQCSQIAGKPWRSR